MTQINTTIAPFLPPSSASSDASSSAPEWATSQVDSSSFLQSLTANGTSNAFAPPASGTNVTGQPATSPGFAPVNGAPPGFGNSSTGNLTAGNSTAGNPTAANSTGATSNAGGSSGPSNPFAANSSDNSSTRAAFTRSVTAGSAEVSMNLPAINFLVTSRAR